MELVGWMNVDFSRLQPVRLDKEDQLASVLRDREFLDRCPDAAVVHVGCGLDSSLERVDHGDADWCDLDLPEAIELRRKLIGLEGDAITSCRARRSTARGSTRGASGVRRDISRSMSWMAPLAYGTITVRMPLRNCSKSSRT